MNIENIPAGMYQLLLMRNGAMEMKKLLVE
jgi:hypothetical protein